MKKAEFIEAVAEKANLSKKDAAVAVNAVLDVIVETVAAKEKVSITGFGAFDSKLVKARVGRNPQTGDTMQISAKQRVSFKVGNSFKEAVKP